MSVAAPAQQTGEGQEAGERLLLRHALATLAYRAGKPLRDAPDGFASLRVHEGTRSPAEILAHVGDLMDWGLGLAEGRHVWHDSAPLPWTEEVARFFAALARFDAYLASEAPLGFSARRLFQGPVADALTHIGQISLLRGMAAAPVRGENYFRADIAVARVGQEQAAPRAEF